ncbi:hypothetical protein D3C81_1998380 [compost metagenome]
MTGAHSWALLRTQACWQRISVGHTRAQLPPRMLAERIFCAAPCTLSCAMLRMNEGMSISLGQAFTQGAS